MPSINGDEFDRLLNSVQTSYLHIEMRSSYGTDVEMPYLEEWRSNPGDVSWLAEWDEMNRWCDTLRTYSAAGKVCRRIHVVDEPLNTYWSWAHAITPPLVEVGEDVRWVNRAKTAGIELPHDDFYLFDDELVVYLHYNDDGSNADFLASTAAYDVDLCRSAFNAAWEISTPHRDYRPSSR